MILDEGKLTDQSTDINEIDSLLSGYSNTVILETETETSGEGSHTLDLNDKSDPSLYYQTGKKKGQRKPPKKGANNQEVKNLSMEKTTILDGLMFLTLIDLVIPTIIMFANNRFNSVKIKINDLRMTYAQRKELAPIADKVIQDFEIEASPLSVLTISMIAVYASNYINSITKD